jgi:hypothetical protein
MRRALAMLATTALSCALPASAQIAAGGWTLREVPRGGPVALSKGPGDIREVVLFCLYDAPWLALRFLDPPQPEALEIGFTFSATSLTASASREPGAGGAYVIALDDVPLASLLAGRDARVALSIDGAPEGVLSLSGSSRAIPRALAPCQ